MFHNSSSITVKTWMGENRYNKYIAILAILTFVSIAFFLILDGYRHDLLAVLQTVALLASVATAVRLTRLIIIDWQQQNQTKLQEATISLDEALEKDRRLTDEINDINDLMEQISLHFSDLFRKIPAPCFCYDSDGNFKEWNKAFENLTLVDPGRIMMEKVPNFIQIDSDSAKMAAVVAGVFRGEAYEGIELQVQFAGGGYKTLLCNTWPLRGDGGCVTAAICAGIDITERLNLEQRMLKHVETLSTAQLKLEDQHKELVSANVKLETLAMSDSLTGLKNHRALQERLQAEYKRTTRYGSTASVLLIDVDRFKKFNDSYGHLSGDSVLREVAVTITNCMRDTDFVARYGGEEFVVVLPHTDYLGSLEAAERLRVAVEQASWELIRITVSIGVATVNASIQQASDLIAKADLALYYCKQHGRNQVVHAQDLPESLMQAGHMASGSAIDLDDDPSLAA